MDLVRLNKATFLPEASVENTGSLIWTERYLDAGEFQFTTPIIAETRLKMPCGELVSLQDSTQVMMIESHSIKLDDDGVLNLVVKGRAVESFFEQRAFHGSYYYDNLTKKSYTSAQWIAVMMWEAVVNATAKSVISFMSNDTSASAAIALGWPIENVLPNVKVGMASGASIGSAVRWPYTGGPAYPKLMEVAGENELGIRSIRPPVTYAGTNVITVSASAAITGAAVTNSPSMFFEVYRGKDRTRSQAVNPVVIFHHQVGDMDTPEQVFSIKGLKSVAMVMGRDPGGPYDGDGYNWNDDYTIAGWDRRVVHLDMGDHFTDTSSQNWYTKTMNAAKSAVRKSRDISFLSGDISETSKYKYNVDYGLGDKVSMFSGYGPEETMYVSEVVRTEDESGERTIPTLVASLLT